MVVTCDRRGYAGKNRSHWDPYKSCILRQEKERFNLTDEAGHRSFYLQQIYAGQIKADMDVPSFFCSVRYL
jgi:hypothetical protein